MIASDRTPVPGPRRVTPDPATRKIPPATTGAAVGSAAVIGSRLGVAGTLTGAVLASIGGLDCLFMNLGIASGDHLAVTSKPWERAC